MFKRFSLSWGSRDAEEVDENEENDAPFQVSAPSDFQHGIHIEHDTATNTFRGVPSSWRDMVPNSETESLPVWTPTQDPT